MGYRRWSGGDWGIGRVGKGDEAREMRQSAWLKRLAFNTTRSATAQSSSRSSACTCHRTKQTIRNQMNQIPAMRREMGSELAHSTVGYQLGANDERRFGRCQIQHSARDFLGRTEALEGNLGLDACRDFRELLRRETQAA